MLSLCRVNVWATVCDAGPTLTQHRRNVTCLQGVPVTITIPTPCGEQHISFQDKSPGNIILTAYKAHTS